MKRSSWMLPWILSACSMAPTPPQSAVAASGDGISTQELERWHWALAAASDRHGARIDELFVASRQPLQLDFHQDRVSVRNACNAINGSYRIEQDRWQVMRMMSTKRACVDAKVAALDAAISRRLEQGGTLRRIGNDKAPQLELHTRDGDRLRFDAQAKSRSPDGAPGQRIFLEVAAQSVACDEPGRPGAHCLRVRELHYDAQGLRKGNPGPWQTLHVPIEGYERVEGIRNVLRVFRHDTPDPQAGQAAVTYVLDMVVESEAGKP